MRTSMICLGTAVSTPSAVTALTKRACRSGVHATRGFLVIATLPCNYNWSQSAVI